MPTVSYLERRKELETYFDRTAVEAWAKLTSDAPVGRIRATVRAGRSEMRATLADWLPPDLKGVRILDAGCGTGDLAADLAARGADVLAVDLSPKLIALARDRHPMRIGAGTLTFRVGDMLRPGTDRFDHAVAMDSFIHYDPRDMTKALALMSNIVDRSILFTFIPRTPALVAMHAIGRLFPKTDRSPSLRPLGEAAARTHIAAEPGLARWRVARTLRVSRGYYTSQALELARA
jgi:magnesium-protoporphyrin O-methyltransferase